MDVFGNEQNQYINFYLTSDMPDDDECGNRNNAQLKMDTFLVSTIRLSVTFVSKFDAPLAWAVWLLNNI